MENLRSKSALLGRINCFDAATGLLFNVSSVELERDVAAPLALFVKKVLLGKCTGVSFVDSTPLRVCRNHFDNFVVNMLGALAAYCCFPKKPCINVQRTLDTQLALF